MACSSSAAGPALRHDARGIRRVRKIRRVSASSADVATAAPPVTLPYVDTVHPPLAGALQECKRVFGEDSVVVMSNSAGR